MRHAGAKNRAAVPVADMEPTSGNAPVGKKKAKRLATPCRVHVHSKRHRLADADGISAKAAIDGIVIAGVLPDDSTKYVQSVTYSQEKIPRAENEETVITIIPIHGADSSPDAHHTKTTPRATRSTTKSATAKLRKDKPQCTNCNWTGTAVCDQCKYGEV